nr:hypothetical protein [Tanacetum cinerariifolium]
DPHLQKLLEKQKNTSDTIDPDERFHVVELLVEGASCLTVVEEGESVESALTGGITLTIGAIA